MGQSTLRSNSDETVDIHSYHYLIRADDLINAMVVQMEHFFIFISIYSELELNILKNSTGFRLFFISFLIQCKDYQIIESRNSNFINGKIHKMYIFKLFLIKCPELIIIGTEPYKIFELTKNHFFSYGSHFSAVFECDSPNRLSGARFIVPLDSHVQLNNRFIYLDKSRLQSIFDSFLKFYGIYESDIENNFFSLKAALLESLYNQDSATASEINKKLAIYSKLFKFVQLLSLNLEGLKLFLPHSTCFRGRIYQLTGISYTFHVEFRYAIYLGLYRDRPFKPDHFLKPNFNEMLSNSFIKLNVFNWFFPLKSSDKEAIV
jgi:hypothetical protein